jgi:mono/diheme cytochrome c family protein
MVATLERRSHAASGPGSPSVADTSGVLPGKGAGPVPGTSGGMPSPPEVDIDMDRYSARRGLHRLELRFAALAIGCMATGCYPKVAPPPGALSANGAASASTRWPGVTAESLAHGRELFLANCNRCHGYPDLAAIGDDHWPGIVEKMGKKADLGPEDRAAVLHFVLASRSEQGAR